MDIIRKFYNDNIPEIQHAAVTSDAYKNMAVKIKELETSINGYIPRTQRELLEEYASALLCRESIIEEEIFASAFKLGVKTVLDSLSENQ